MDFVRWFEAAWILVHHLLIGTVKFAMDWGVLATPRDPWGPVFLQLFLIGAGLAHTAFGLDAFGLRGGLSQVCRFAAELRGDRSCCGSRRAAGTASSRGPS